MKKTNALKLRQELGVLLADLQRGGEPVLIERRSKPAAVLISIEDYQKRFVDREADTKRQEIVDRIKNTRIKLPKGVTTLSLLEEGRR